MKERLIIGTRKSALALWQSEFVKQQLQEAFPGLEVELRHIVTKGDLSQGSNAPIPVIGGKGLFTAELEEALLAKTIDIAVHSLKDLPTVLPDQFTIGAIPVRAPAEDVLISRSGARLEELPTGAAVGSSSLRRASQLLAIRSDLKIEHIRGNIDTRIKKAKDPHGIYDATLLARAGVERLGLMNEVTQILPFDLILPAPGQGALGVECRQGDTKVLSLLASLHHAETAIAVTAERAFLNALGAGCNTPVAALAEIVADANDSKVVFRGRCLSPDGSRCIEVSGEGVLRDAEALGLTMAQEAERRGFNELMSDSIFAA